MYGGGLIGAYNAAKPTFSDLPSYEYQGYPNWKNGLSNGGLTGTGGTITGMTGTLPDSWAAYTTTAGTPVGGTLARTDGRGSSYITVTATAAAAAARAGITQQIDLKVAFSAKAWIKGARVLGSYGDHWVVTTAGTSTGTEPTAMAAASTIGQTCTDASTTVVFTRVDTIKAGDLYEVIVAGQVLGASSMSIGCMPVVLVNANSGTGGGRLNNPSSPDLYPVCYQQSSSTPGTKDWVLRSAPLSHDAATASLGIYAYLQMANTLTATLALASVELIKIN
jgi:hypothetical protein